MSTFDPQVVVESLTVMWGDAYLLGSEELDLYKGCKSIIDEARRALPHAKAIAEVWPKMVFADGVVHVSTPSEVAAIDELIAAAIFMVENCSVTPRLRNALAHIGPAA